MKKGNPKQGEIWLFDPDPVKGTEMGKKVRQGLIMSCNELNDGFSGLIIIIPLTSKEKGIYSHVKIEPSESGLNMASFAVCEQIRAVSKERLIKRIGAIRRFSILEEIHGWIRDLTMI